MERHAATRFGEGVLVGCQQSVERQGGDGVDLGVVWRGALSLQEHLVVPGRAASGADGPRSHSFVQVAGVVFESHDLARDALHQVRQNGLGPVNLETTRGGLVLISFVY